jgi:enoyl-CoA hydratase/carnithine racemase
VSNDLVLVERQGRLTVITINRPEAHNALNPVAQLALQDAFDQFAKDDNQWVAILTGAGPKALCGGMDLKAQAEKPDLFTLERGFGGFTARFDLTKPVIGAVNGIAMGGGFELVLACDIVVASANAVFALPEPRVGLAALGGGLQRLPHEIGLKRAMGLLLTGRRIKAKEALSLGLVNEVPSGDVVEAAKRWAREILACSPLAVRATKEATLRGLATPLADSMAEEWGYPAMQAMLASEDAIEGPQAFAAKRTPVWTGR